MSVTRTQYDCKIKTYNDATHFKVIQVECRTSKQAQQQAKKQGRVLSVRKASLDSIYSSIEQLNLEPSIYAHQPEYKYSEYKPVKYRNRA